MWAPTGSGAGPSVRLFAYAPARGAACAEKLYAGIRHGTTFITDGYEVYNGIAKAGGLMHLGRWDHVHRPFIVCVESTPKAARSPGQVVNTLRAADWQALRCRVLRQGAGPRGFFRQSLGILASLVAPSVR
ncbi:transposase [Variovorax sp. RCC_210]|uniref:IS66 family transposase n=1 Tax=Variovorax sp. RCC_210 TaxID=3239217 RepID=UPI0035238AD4